MASARGENAPDNREEKDMKRLRVCAAASFAALALLAAPALSSAETIRVGLPTKTFWPTTVAETAVHQKLFEKEGISAELTIYRSGAETFEGMAAGAADIILDPPSLVSAGRKKGVMSKIVPNASMGNFGWQLMAPAKSPLDVKGLNGKKIATPPAPAATALPTLWCRQSRAGTRRVRPPAGPSAGAAWRRPCPTAMSMRPWCILPEASRSSNPARPRPPSTMPQRCRRIGRGAGLCWTSLQPRSRNSC